MAANRRLLREFKKIKDEARKDFAVVVTPESIRKWQVTIFGADETDWQGAALKLEINFPDSYPIDAPDIHFVGVIPFHPNVYANGKICLDLLQHNWSSAYGVDAMITSIQTLLTAPNPASPANNTAAQLFTADYPEYQRRVKGCVYSTWNRADAENH
jgi:ubiquitin-conjugating enzyme E2 A